MKYLLVSTIAVLFSITVLKSQTDSTKEMERPFQLTFVTPLGTNGVESFKYTNRVSLNVLVGVSKGVTGFEAGGIANVVLKDVKGVQFAGMANVALGEVNGGQFSSYFNYCGKNLKGVSFAGVTNIALGELHGGQFAGAFNLNKKGGKGVQIAGYSNVMLGDFKGTQISGFANIAKGNIEGTQLSAGVNYAKKVKGVQIGFINIADTVDGATIGFINLVRKGKHQIELSGDELFYTNLSYRTGTEAFYTIFTAGYAPGSKNNLWHFGYGAGTSFKLKNKLRGDVSMTAHHVSNGSFYWGTSELVRLYCGVEYKIAKKFAVALGPTFNLYTSDNLLTKYNTTISDVVPYNSYNHTTRDDFNVKGWIGGRIALRFL